MAENTYAFEIPTQHKSIIKVIGVGGGGSNAVNHMYGLGIKDVEFVVCNTDHQALDSSPVPQKIQLGLNLTHGLGAGANPEKGRNAALESKEDIREMLADNTRMVFITAGMGGGTGTGAAPIIAQVAKELDILTVGIVTSPFSFEGPKKRAQAEEGIRQLKEHCDTVLVILNDKIKEIYGNQSIREAFSHADNVLTTAAKGIAEIITVPGYVNVDFEDVKTVMKNAGAAVMGSAQTYGENRARRAAEAALNSPLLNNHNVTGAQKILLSIMSGEEAELQMDELTNITDYIQEFAGADAEMIFGHGIDPDLGEHLRVTVIATGFESVDEMTLKKVVEPTFKSQLTTAHQIPRPNVQPVAKTIHDLERSRGVQPSLFGQEEEKPKPQPKEEKPFTFVWDSPKSAEPPQKPPVSIEDDLSFEFDIDDEDQPNSRKEKYELDLEFSNSLDIEEDELDDLDIPLDELKGAALPPSKKIQLMEERRRREELLDQSRSTSHITPEVFKAKINTPAYERRKVTLQQVPPAANRNISRYNLSDDNQILGNNRFLHDNVD